MRSFYSLSLRFLVRRPGKTFGSVMGIALGVAVIVAAVSAGEAARLQLDRSFKSMLGSADLVISHARPFEAKLAYKAIEGQPVAAKASQLVYPARIDLGPAGQKSRFVGVSVFGLDRAETRRLWKIKMASGRFVFSENNVVLSQTLARRLNRRIGDEIEIFTGAGRVRKRVAGVLDEVGLGNQGIPAVYMDLTKARREQQLQNKLSYLFLKLKSGVATGATRKGLSGRLGPDITVGRTPATSAYALNMINILSQVLFALGLCALTVGTLLIYQSTNVATMQMIPTLALIKALGATKRQLIKVFLLESALVGLSASITGGAIGFFLAKTVASMLGSVLAAGRTQFLPSPSLFLATILLGVGVAMTATCLPIIKSSRVSVAEALRLKATGGRRGPGRVLGALAHLVDPVFLRIRPSAIITQRSLANNFRRLRFTAVCLIAGLAMIIGAQMGVGAFKETMGQYFTIYGRQSFVVRAVEMIGGDVAPRMPLATARQLKKIPGVQDAVPFYLGGARFRGRDTMMQSAAARETDDWVYVKGEPALAAARFHAGGWIAVSTSFAKKNKISVGDAINLESGGYGHRFRVAAVIVSLREGVSISWPDLQKYFKITEADEFEVLPVDRAAYEALGARLEKFTRQRGYFLLTSKQFKEQMDGYLNGFAAVLLAVTGSVLTLTALALANMMVVGALERRRLLGVLRGQGMTRRQLAGLLISENLAVGLISLPAGLLLGYIAGSFFKRFIGEAMGITMTGADSLWIFPLSALLMLAVLYVTAVFPARRIASTPVAEALRYE